MTSPGPARGEECVGKKKNLGEMLHFEGPDTVVRAVLIRSVLLFIVLSPPTTLQYDVCLAYA